MGSAIYTGLATPIDVSSCATVSSARRALRLWIDKMQYFNDRAYLAALYKNNILLLSYRILS